MTEKIGDISKSKNWKYVIISFVNISHKLICFVFVVVVGAVVVAAAIELGKQMLKLCVSSNDVELLIR